MVWCDRCANSSEEFPEELSGLVESFRRHYPLVRYCRLYSAIVVADPKRPTAYVDKSTTCDGFKPLEQKPG